MSKRVAVVSALVEGNSLRSTCRMTGVAMNTVLKLLAELGMPAMLLPSVLPPAMLDFINTAECRDSDDRRGLVDFVQRLRIDRVEQYLALLTTDGPLVPMSEGSFEVTR